MKTIHKQAVVASFFTLVQPGLQVAHAQQGIKLSTDNLSFLEEPLAINAGGFTILFNSLLDLSATRDLDDDTDEGRLAAIGQLSAEKQLKNALTVGATYRGEENEGYDDQFAAYVRGVWGRVSVGDVTENTEIATERMDGVGNADLTLDNFYGLLEGDGLAYSGRFSAYTINGAIDEDSHLDLGLTFERPLGNKDYRFTTRLIQSEYTAETGVVLDTTGFVITGELIYGSLLSDLSLGLEKLENDTYDFERQFIAAGLSYKHNRWSFSLEGQLGDVEGERESAWSLGTRYDIARGISANFGINHVDSAVALDGVALTDDDTNEAVLSLRYEF